MSKHTKEPWHVGGANKCTVYDKFGQRIADAFEGVMVSHRSYFECCANASLIAAAPDLLDDLIEAAATLRRYEVLHRAKGTDESTAKAEVNAELAGRFESTIAKARGDL